MLSRVKEYLKNIRVYMLISHSKLFDPQFYLLNNLDVARNCVNPIKHYIHYGWREGRDPSRFFDTKGYLEKYPDVRQKKINPLYHYIKYGKKENRIPSKVFMPVDNIEEKQIIAKRFFDEQYYLIKYPQVRKSRLSPFMHFINIGWKKGYNPSVRFNTIYYMNQNNDVKRAKINPLLHYIRNGEKEGREPHVSVIEPSKEDIGIAIQNTANGGKKFSVIVPTWNRKNTICRSLDSILSQTYNNFEIIICDDGSTDGTESMINLRYREEVKSGKIKFLYNVHQGVSAARNTALRKVTGDWIAYLDSDDTWRKHFLLMMASAFIKKPEHKTAYAQILIHDSVQKYQYVLKSQFDADLLRRRNFISMVVYAHHREVLETCGQFDEQLKRFVDWDMILRHTSVYEPLYLPYVLADYERVDIYNNVTFTESHEENIKIIEKKLSNENISIAIKVPAPDPQQAMFWGDYHLALALQRGLRKAGFSVRIDALSEWYNIDMSSDVVIVFRGLSRYEPKPDQLNIMWNISHPDKITIEEYDSYDLVLVASNKHAGVLNKRCSVPVAVMHQFTDPQIFFPKFVDSIQSELLFVGNSRKQYRRAVKACVEQNLNIDIYGTLWEDIIPNKYIKGEFIKQESLSGYYHSARIVLNDHWDSMREYGFVSNRVYDVGASGGFLLTDNCDGIGEMFDGSVAEYSDDKNLKLQVEYFLNHPEERSRKAEKLREVVLGRHTLTHRVEQLVKAINEMVKRKKIANLRETKKPLDKHSPKIEVYQTVVSDDQLGRVQYPFIEYDVRQSNPSPHWHEYWQFLALYDRKKKDPIDYWGNVSFRFSEKTGITPDAFLSFIRNNPGHDVYFINPFEFLDHAFKSPWEQGDLWHPGLIEITQTIFDRLNYKIDLRNLKFSADLVGYCDFFVGNKHFWDLYIYFTRPIFDFIENCADDKLVRNINRRAYKTRPCSYHPFIMERLFSTLLAIQSDSICSLKYSYPTEHLLKEACRAYRTTAQAYNRLYEKCHEQEKPLIM